MTRAEVLPKTFEVGTSEGVVGAMFGQAQSLDEELFRPSGDLTAWLQAINDAITRRPKIAAALYASLSTPLLRVMGAEGFGLIFLGGPAIGKSTVVKMAASAWANPRLIQHWGEQVVPRKRVPFFFDNKTNWAQASYAQADAVISEWGGVVVAADRGDLGSVERIRQEHSKLLAVWGSPFIHQDDSTAEAVLRLDFACADNYGLAYPEMMARIRSGPDIADKVKTMYRDNRMAFAVHAGKLGGVASSLAAQVATIFTAGQVIHGLFPELDGIQPEAVGKDLWDWVCMTSDHETKAELAMDLIRQYVTKNQNRIVGIRPEGAVDPHNGWIGAVYHTDPNHIWILEGAVRAVLGYHNLDADLIILEWMQCEAVPTRGGRPYRTKFVGATQARVMGFSRDYMLGPRSPEKG